ncbi:MAG TPA: hypothetical protein VMT52_08525 [Planctomycetota bacterium]|nr:hypothetical protein [Planctomycetota bacterium]
MIRCDAVVSEVRNRMPFRYGKAVLTAAPVLHVRLWIETADRRQAWGLAADCLPPLWFDKDPSKSFRQNVEDQILAFRKAREVYLGLGETARSAAEIWMEAHGRLLEEGAGAGLNPLTSSFGGSFLERAMIDALCRLKGVSFLEALKQDLLGIETSTHLPPGAPKSIICRHTVGLSDPITVGEVPASERIDDGLPQALEEDIELYGLKAFKVKVHGEHERDLDRLSRIAALVHQRCPGGYLVTLDGNEQYGELKDVERLLEAVRSKPYGSEFLDSVLYIEQPLPREAALEPAAAGAVASLSSWKPVLIDESDGNLDSFQKAVALGYAGVSHKNAKGVFKSLLNRALVLQLNREEKKGSRKGIPEVMVGKGSKATRKDRAPVYFQTGEDLATLPVVALQQDLASLAALGIEHAERNGHHYFHGLDHLPASEADSALHAHPDLYEERADSIFLKIQSGAISLESILTAGYGYASEIAFDERTPLDAWSFDRLSMAGKDARERG